MKKLITFILLFLLMFALLACTAQKIDKAKPVFETENITHITLCMASTDDKGFEVPQEHLAEITTWLGSFRIAEKADDLPPGSNFYSVRIEYADGTVIENGLSTIKVGRVTYNMRYGTMPRCFYEILSLEESAQ